MATTATGSSAGSSAAGVPTGLAAGSSSVGGTSTTAVIKRRVMEQLAEHLRPIVAVPVNASLPGINAGDVIVEDPGTERTVCFPNLVIRAVGKWPFVEFNDDEIWTTPTTQTVEVGDLSGQLEIIIGSTNQYAREVLEDRILNVFTGAVSKEGWGTQGVLVLQLDSFTVNGGANLAVVPVGYVLEDDTWQEEMVFERKRFATLSLGVDVPVLVTRTGVSDIDTLVLSLTNDLASDTPTEEVEVLDPASSDPPPDPPIAPYP